MKERKKKKERKKERHEDLGPTERKKERESARQHDGKTKYVLLKYTLFSHFIFRKTNTSDPSTIFHSWAP